MKEGLPDDLFDDVEGEDREAREALLSWLVERGLTVDELREAKREQRLALLPTEHVLTRGCNLSLNEAAKRSGREREFIERTWRVAGLPIPDPDEPVIDDEEDLEAMRISKLALDAGISEEAYVEITRVVGRAAASIAQAIGEQTAAAFLERGGTEAEHAMRLEEAAEQLTPLIPELVGFPVRQHLRNALRYQALERKGGGVTELRDTRQMAIGFADLVGYSALTERVSVSESSEVAARLEKLATAVAQPPVRLVKLIGDEAMFVCEEVEPLVAALVELREKAEAESALPALHLGIAAGEVLARAGDVYGPAVNHASRLTGASDEGQLLISPEVAEALDGDYDLRELDPIELKGVGEVKPVEVVGGNRS